MITMCFRIVMNILDCTIATKPTSSRMPVARTLRTPKPSAMPVPAPSPRGVSTPSWPLQRLSTPRSTRTSPTIPLRLPLPLSLPSTPWCCSARRPVPRSRNRSNRRAHPTVAPGMLPAINGLRTAQLFATTATRPATRLRFARAAAVLRAALLPIFNADVVCGASSFWFFFYPQPWSFCFFLVPSSFVVLVVSIPFCFFSVFVFSSFAFSSFVFSSFVPTVWLFMSDHQPFFNSQ